MPLLKPIQHSVTVLAPIAPAVPKQLKKNFVNLLILFILLLVLWLMFTKSLKLLQCSLLNSLKIRNVFPAVTSSLTTFISNEMSHQESLVSVSETHLLESDQLIYFCIFPKPGFLVTRLFVILTHLGVSNVGLYCLEK